jgi:uncharacterized membrane protein
VVVTEQGDDATTEATSDPTAETTTEAKETPPGELQARLERLEAMIDPEIKATRHVGSRLVPAWRRVTAGEARWQAGVAIAVAIGLQFVVPDRLSMGPGSLLPAAEAVLLIALLIANPGRIDRRSPHLRSLSLGLIAVMSLANAASAGQLIVGVVRGTAGKDAGELLTVGGAIWLTNVIVFALWYWELDRGGPAARAMATKEHLDFLFPQMASPEVATPEWEPQFPDYFYLSFTNATAFSPTDTLPLTRWTKMLMLLQSAVSLSTVALVIARAINILK